MQSFKLLVFAAVSPLLVPTASSAGLIGDLLDPILNPSGGTVAPIPEPSGALVMSVALVTVAAFVRFRRK